MALYPLSKQYSPDFSQPNKRPVGDIELDLKNSLTKGMWLASVMNVKGNLANKKPFTNLLGGHFSPSTGVEFDNVGDQGISLGATSQPDVGFSGNKVTVLVVSNAQVRASQRNVVINQRLSGEFYGAGFNNDAALNIQSGIFSLGGTIFANNAGAAFIPSAITGKTSAYCISRNISAYIGSIDGESKATTVTNSTTLAPGENGELNIGDLGGNFTGTGFGAQDSISLIYAWNRALNQSEIDSLTANPYQLLKPTNPTIYFTPSISSGITVTGTAVPTQTEADIVTGGKTIILTVAGDTFVTGSSSEDGIAGGSDSDIAASGTNWDSLIKTTLDNTDVVLSGGNTIATITLPAFATYDIPGTETITWTIPAASLTTSVTPVVATPTHTITAVVSGVSIPVIMNQLRNQGIN